MFIKIRKRWELKEHQATSETVYINRRQFMQKAALGSALISTGLIAGCEEQSAEATTPSGEKTLSLDPSAQYYPAGRNELYKLDRALSDERLATTYNNFYEFGSSKNIYQKAQALPIRPWDIVLDGMVEKPLTLGIDDLLSKVDLEERLYRHRCVEAWSMAVPWTGFPLRKLLSLAQPLSSARYVRMETFNLPDIAVGQKASWYPWPYIEGLTIEEASNDLAFLATGIYGKPMPKQNGAPLRLVTPWKYGFKSTKSIVRFTFTDERPVSFWEEIQGSEYGFWANVNPEVPHARWSQASEQPLGQSDRVPTLLFNGYAEEVADLYKGVENERLYT
ncbi:protein-methionine-sulfoxide reductase catalytic subunit MsrP [Kiloniella laminariae]|uniref:Protein-methionine-sulfoxide reductase catalytic subunit MsrP n=1 Tax=Kiloniella laminariae TaxID=454162 RepID=A0ABT4LL98_9PROT|nr:protein-methionine-sulfoxide reductase catalytic subunit MsrP [Kiloniella laminariae]MCZ4281890.1 protein-methionine-sulfoxide reductase catalytic subunit MsrP [Kiloniella laminariae]